LGAGVILRGEKFRLSLCESLEPRGGYNQVLFHCVPRRNRVFGLDCSSDRGMLAQAGVKLR
jgi:hypothetical protein